LKTDFYATGMVWGGIAAGEEEFRWLFPEEIANPGTTIELVVFVCQPDPEEPQKCIAYSVVNDSFMEVGLMSILIHKPEEIMPGVANEDGATLAFEIIEEDAAYRDILRQVL